jgi:hypothetical protein
MWSPCARAQSNPRRCESDTEATNLGAGGDSHTDSGSKLRKCVIECDRIHIAKLVRTNHIRAAASVLRHQAAASWHRWSQVRALGGTCRTWATRKAWSLLVRIRSDPSGSAVWTISWYLLRRAHDGARRAWDPDKQRRHAGRQVIDADYLSQVSVDGGVYPGGTDQKANLLQRRKLLVLG